MAQKPSPTPDTIFAELLKDQSEEIELMFNHLKSLLNRDKLRASAVKMLWSPLSLLSRCIIVRRESDQDRLR